MERPERWRDNWRVVTPPGAALVELGRSRTSLAAARERVADLPAGMPVVLAAAAPGARRRCRTFARRMGIQVGREYLAFPSASMPAYLVENQGGPLRAFVRSVLVAPPRARLSPAVGAGLAVVRWVAPRRLVSALAPGRVLVGRRT